MFVRFGVQDPAQDGSEELRWAGRTQLPARLGKQLRALDIEPTDHDLRGVQVVHHELAGLAIEFCGILRPDGEVPEIGDRFRAQRALEGMLSASECRHIADRCADNGFARDGQRAEADLDRELSALSVAREQDLIETHRAGAGRCSIALAVLDVCRSQAFGQEMLDLHSVKGRNVIAKEARALLVCEQDRTGRVGNQHGIGRAEENTFVNARGLGQRALVEVVHRTLTLGENR